LTITLAQGLTEGILRTPAGISVVDLTFLRVLYSHFPMVHNASLDIDTASYIDDLHPHISRI